MILRFIRSLEKEEAFLLGAMVAAVLFDIGLVIMNYLLF